MLKLNEDVLYLILEELKDDRKSLYSCLLVNRTLCEKTVSILWKNPGQYYTSMKLLFNVILLHLSEESRKIFKNQGINLFNETYQRKPSFNYINFWKFLNLHLLECMIFSIKNIEKSKLPIIRNEILNLFVNKNTKFIYLDIPQQFNYQLHHISGAEHCFSKLQWLYCGNNTDQNILEGLAKICTSIKKLRFDIIQYNKNDNPGIFKLIEAQKNLKQVYFVWFTNKRNESYRKSLEESLIKNSTNIQNFSLCWKPITEILSYLVNLLSLELNLSFYNLFQDTNWNHLEKVSLPLLKILRAQKVPSKILANLIENTNGNLTEISILYDGIDDKRLIQAIHKNCPKLKYLKLLIKNDNILELEKVLINCQYLNGLFIIADPFNEPDWYDLFKIFIKSSSMNLFKFKFSSIWSIKLLDSLKSFFDNWIDRNPMLLQIILTEHLNIEQQQQQQRRQQLDDLIQKYKLKGIIKKYDIDGTVFEDFEWIQKKI
ncbi:hypothetical protein C1645_833668 [Glomus cerebriforme]|uniref:F-box domain-containing protein n=1 Tax=Glomus cerebriforme TaxID=658196 RepID=A0A397SFQ9_9GLOM|nr:hypothetical protein C1645_833668 [Glomus cerebriforme]